MAVALAVGALGPAIKVLKLVTKPILRQFNYLCCFTSNINSLKDEAKNLDDALSGLEGEIERARDNVQEPVAEVKTWLTKSKKIKDEINQIVSEAPKVESGCLKIGARFSLSKKAKKTTDCTKEFRGQKKFDVKFQPGPPAARREAQLRKTYEFVSRKQIEEDIMTTLRGGDVNMIGICGMGGLGKTTMARKLMNRALEENVCQEVVIATVSENVDISKTQDEIGGQLGLEKLKDEKSESARATLLSSRLSGTKRILLVLDDVWKTLELEDFGIPSDSKGCTILFTSRNRDVLNQLKVQNIFGMDALSEDEAWPFFKERAGTCVDDRELNPIAKQVAKECGGLPINLAAVAAGLRDKRNAAIWKDTLRDLKQRVPDNVKFDNKTYSSLKRSYDLLESEIAKSIFLLCCLFPEDANIPVEYLTYFCMGLDMFEGITNMEDARNKMWVETEFLKDRSLLLESDEKDCVRMHDVVRDVCTFIAKEKEYISKDGCTWISSSHLVGQRNALLSGSRCPNLHLLFLNRRYDDSSRFKLDDAFLQGMRELYVLCVENYHSLTTLPHPTQSLGKLNTLILDSCDELKTISVVGELVNLEILICRGCHSIQKLPSEMKGLYRLKVLELTGCINLQSIERGIISSLVRLEELKMHWSFNRWEAEDREERENASIKELEALPNLACLEIDIYDRSLLTENMPLISSKKIVSFKIRTDGGNIPSEFSKAMRLYLERESCLGDWIEMQFLRDTEYLYLKGDGANNVELAKSQKIRWLKLSGCESMKNVVATSGGSDDATVFFPSIEHLMLYSLPQLQEICDGSISSCSFQNLKELRLANLSALTQFWKSSSVPQSNYVPHFTNLSSIVIDECPGLRNLEELLMAGKDCLLQLQELRIGKCEMMEQVFLWNNTTSIEPQQKRHVIFPKLKEVKLDSLPNLTTFYQGIQSTEFPLLMEMKIEKCPKMKSILGSSADIDEDGSLHLFCQPQKVSFGSLEELMIDHVGSKSIFTLSVAANLRSLRELRIRNCDEMIKVIEDEQHVASGGERILVFPKLEILELKYLLKLATFCDSKCEVELPSLRTVEIERCPNMKNFSLGLVAMPNLEAFTTDLMTYVGVGVNVSFDNLKDLLITQNENPYNHQKISTSLFSGLERLIFFTCKGGMNLFSSSAVGNLVNLKVLQISYFDKMLISVIEEEAEDGRVVSGGEISSVVFPKLEELFMSWLPNLVRFCEWKRDVKFPSLRQVDIRHCRNMESFGMGFVAAPKLEIFLIDLKEIGATRDLNGALQQLHLPREKWPVSFSVKIDYNPFYGHKIPSSLFKRLEELTINKYEGSMSLFTLSAAANLVSLRELHIEHCDEMIKVIEDEQQQQRNILVFPKLEELYLDDLPKLVAFCDCKCEVELPSLRKVEIGKCPNMKNFILSKAGKDCLPQLEHLSIKNCEMMEQVFLWNDDEEAAGKNKTSIESQQKRHVIFPKLKEVELVSLPNLTTFYQGIQGIQFPLLMEMKIEKCPNWKNIIIGTSGAGIDEADSLLVLNKKVSFGSLEVLMIDDVGSMSIFTLSMAANLRELSIRNCAEMIKVIENDQQQESILLFPKLEIVKFEYLPKLVRFCDWKCEVELPLLRKVQIERCPNMENFSMGFVATPYLESFKTDLNTYVGVGLDVAFSSLKKLKISRSENPLQDDKISLSIFNGLEKLTFILYKGSMSLFSSSAVRNLGNLKELRIGFCDEILKVIEDEEEEDNVKVVSGGAIRTVVFPKLEELSLKELPKLVSFCGWKCDLELPSLTNLWIMDCRNVESFSMGYVAAPNLKIVEIDEEEIDATKDLNGALQQHYLAHQEKENEEEKEESSEEEDDQN